MYLYFKNEIIKTNNLVQNKDSIMQVDTMRLCGPDLTYEKEQFIKGNANRVHRQAEHLQEAIREKGKLGLNIALGSTINNIQQIMISVNKGEPRTFKNESIPRETVKSELLILAQDLLKVTNATSQIDPLILEDSLRDQISQIEKLSREMIATALTKYEADMVFMGSRLDKDSTLQCLPREVIDIIIKTAFEVKVDFVRDNLANELKSPSPISRLTSSQKPLETIDIQKNKIPTEEPAAIALKKKSKLSSITSFFKPKS
jgi:hypothetical protein